MTELGVPDDILMLVCLNVAAVESGCRGTCANLLAGQSEGGLNRLCENFGFSCQNAAAAAGTTVGTVITTGATALDAVEEGARGAVDWVGDRTGINIGRRLKQRNSPNQAPSDEVLSQPIGYVSPSVLESVVIDFLVPDQDSTGGKRKLKQVVDADLRPSSDKTNSTQCWVEEVSCYPIEGYGSVDYRNVTKEDKGTFVEALNKSGDGPTQDTIDTLWENVQYCIPQYETGECYEFILCKPCEPLVGAELSGGIMGTVTTGNTQISGKEYCDCVYCEIRDGAKICGIYP
jgi:hypothetical protein